MKNRLFDFLKKSNWFQRERLSEFLSPFWDIKLFSPYDFYSRAASIPGRLLFKGGFYSRVAPIRENTVYIYMTINVIYSRLSLPAGNSQRPSFIGTLFYEISAGGGGWVGGGGGVGISSGFEYAGGWNMSRGWDWKRESNNKYTIFSIPRASSSIYLKLFTS